MSYLGQVELKSSEIRRIDVTGSTSATHTLTWTPASEQSLIITINGIKQQNNYSISGTTLTLDTALVATDAMEVIGILDIGEAVVPPDDSITNAMVKSDAAIAQSKLATLVIDTTELADDAVTADKLANSINTEIAANTAKVTNATHTGDVTGATALTIANDAVDIAMLSATGTADATTFLRGDNAWATPATAAVLQVVSVYPDLAVTSIATASWTEVDSGLRIAITPQSATSTLFLTCNFIFGGNHTSNITHFKLYDITNTADINLATQGGSRTPMHGSVRQYDSDDNDVDNVQLEVQVSASNTTARTYGLYAQNESGTTSKYFFGTASDTDAIGIAKPMLRVMEVAA